LSCAPGADYPAGGCSCGRCRRWRSEPVREPCDFAVSVSISLDWDFAGCCGEQHVSNIGESSDQCQHEEFAIEQFVICDLKFCDLKFLELSDG